MPSIENEYMERGYRGTKKTIDKMHRLVAKGKLHPTLHKIASWLRLQVPSDKRGRTRELADRVFWFVKKHGVFQNDPFQIERIEHPIEAMRPVIEARRAGTYNGPGLFVGDCDLYSIMLATLGGLLGFQYSWETVKVDPSRPDEFSHIYPALLVEGKWVAYDASTERATPDWRPNVPPQMFSRWPEQEIEKVLGMSGMNGFGNGLGDVESYETGWRYGMIPRDYQGYAIPKSIGGDGGRLPGETPEVDMSYFGSQIPGEPQEPMSEVAATGIPEMKRVPVPGPEMRVSNMRGPYLPRPVYEPRKAYYSTSHPYDPTWPFSRQVEVRYEQPAVAPVNVEEPELYQAIPGYETITETGYGLADAGMGQTREELLVTITDLRAKSAASTAAGDPETARAYDFQIEEIQNKVTALDQAGGSVWSAVDKTIQDMVGMVPGVSDAYVQQMRDKYKARIAEAEARIAASQAAKAQSQVELVGGVSRAKPFYTSPVALGAAALVLAGGAYALSR